MQAVGALLVACVFLMIGAMASAQKIVSPPEIAPPPIPLQPPAPSAGEQSGAPQTERNEVQQHSADDRRGTEQSPLIVKIQRAPKGSEEAAQAEREKENQAADKWRSDIIAIVIAVAAAIQAAALVFTIYVMMRTAKRQLRAYVNITDAKFHAVPGGYPPNIVLTLKNFGTTPARNVTFRKYTFLANPGAETFDRPRGPINIRDLAPTQANEQVILPQVNHVLIGIGAFTLFFHGIVEYKDVFGASRYTEFRFRLLIDDDGIERAHFVACPEGNRTT